VGAAEAVAGSGDDGDAVVEAQFGHGTDLGCAEAAAAGSMCTGGDDVLSIV
jgi:hypothetical protein